MPTGPRDYKLLEMDIRQLAASDPDSGVCMC